jgi:hypothetical protein
MSPPRNRLVVSVLLAALSVWSLWAFGVQRVALYPFEDNAISRVASAASLALGVLMVATTAVFSKRLWLRFASVGAVFVSAFATNQFGSPYIFSWDKGAYIFVVFSAVMFLLAAFKAPVVAVPLRLAAPAAGVLLIMVTQIAAPNVPDAVSIPYARVPVAQQAGCPDPEAGYAPEPGRMMMPPSLCHRYATETLAGTTSDGCYSAGDAYAMLAMLQGPSFDDPAASSRTAQTYLTGAWLRGEAHMESGFCAKTKGRVQTFSRPDGTVLFTASRDYCLLDYSRDPWHNMEPDADSTLGVLENPTEASC